LDIGHPIGQLDIYPNPIGQCPYCPNPIIQKIIGHLDICPIGCPNDQLDKWSNTAYHGGDKKKFKEKEIKKIF
jgi:hypothetical protein